ncbi:hypothetical protein MHH81_21160 [Psychrobacillus sp. FSL H8-0484]|uniref:hypothetical protein n=1 Tax=Psychrobacillus sp. FSL H8-0484 TaxID=2921390 RepID=UPI0030FD0479
MGILTGCGKEIELKTSDELKNSEQTHAESKAFKDKQIAVTKDVREVKPLTVDGIEKPDLSVYQYRFPEYKDLKLYMVQIIKDWSE